MITTLGKQRNIPVFDKTEIHSKKDTSGHIVFYFSGAVHQGLLKDYIAFLIFGRDCVKQSLLNDDEGVLDESRYTVVTRVR